MSLRVGFSKDGLMLNGKNFHPLNVPFKNITLESNVPVDPPRAEDILAVFQRPGIRNVSREEGIEVLRQMLERLR